MESKLTQGIKISVKPDYQPDLSDPRKQKFVFTYKVEIKNESDQKVQLLYREWVIFDSSGVKRKVRGEGVVGKQPELAPGEQFIYESWCALSSEIGYMQGHYIMKQKLTSKEFRVEIPRFVLITNFLEN
jgi:ApaG protein